jgi:quercetin dioxygenase-like cupin family protein
MGDGPTAEERTYFELPDGGIRAVITRMPPGRVQNMHRHVALLDITYVIEGEIVAIERDHTGNEREERLEPGDWVVFSPPAYHNLRNASSDRAAMTLTIKKLRDGTYCDADTFAELCTTDWVPFSGSGQ